MKKNVSISTEGIIIALDVDCQLEAKPRVDFFMRHSGVSGMFLSHWLTFLHKFCNFEFVCIF